MFIEKSYNFDKKGNKNCNQPLEELNLIHQQKMLLPSLMSPYQLNKRDVIPSPMTWAFLSVNCSGADGRHIGETDPLLTNIGVKSHNLKQSKARPGCSPIKL